MASVGLVLGAGGVVGHGWHAGVLAALADGLGWDARSADVVVGTSAGSVVGAVLRGGIGPKDVYDRALGQPLSAEAARVLQRAGIGAPPALPTPKRPARPRPASVGLLARAALTPWRLRPGLLVAGGLPRGGTDPGVIAAGVGALHRDGWPERPYWACALRLSDGRLVVFGRDGSPPAEVGEAVAASCAIPGFFTPVRIGGHDHVDGGAHSPTNADQLAGLGLDVVVVSSPMSLDSGALRRPPPDQVLRLAHRATLGRELRALRRSRTPVVTLQPGRADLAVMGGTAYSMDAGRRERVARTARETTLRRLDNPRLREALAPLG